MYFQLSLCNLLSGRSEGETVRNTDIRLFARRSEGSGAVIETMEHLIDRTEALKGWGSYRNSGALNRPDRSSERGGAIIETVEH